ncbi:zinc finger CCCH domain protein [Trifolium repens]|nr:zinc finger CCCH domain protein [Trifolium repens]
MHTGYCRPTTSPPPAAAIQELRATIRVLPPKDWYISTLRNNVRSRAGGAAIGCSYRNEQCCIVKKGGETIDLEPCLTYTSTIEPTLAPVAVEQTMTTRAATSFAVLVWTLWKNRNNSVWNNEKETGRCLGVKARQLWTEWYMVQNMQQRTAVAVQQQQQLSWQRPPLNWYKCNVDAGFHQEVNKTSAGWCVRDHRGHCIMAGTTWREGHCSILEGEAMALLHALREMEQLGLSQVIFETDSKSVVDAIQHYRGGNSEFSSIIGHINNVLLLNPNFMVKFIKRQANMVAHALARAAISWSRRYIVNTLPTCIATLLNNEMN